MKQALIKLWNAFVEARQEAAKARVANHFWY